MQIISWSDSHPSNVQKFFDSKHSLSPDIEGKAHNLLEDKRRWSQLSMMLMRNAVVHQMIAFLWLSFVAISLYFGEPIFFWFKLYFMYDNKIHPRHRANLAFVLAFQVSIRLHASRCHRIPSRFWPIFDTFFLPDRSSPQAGHGPTDSQAVYYGCHPMWRFLFFVALTSIQLSCSWRC